MSCQFCGSPPKMVFKGEPVEFLCGTRPHNLEPATEKCLRGLVIILQERIKRLEMIVLRPRPKTVREMAIQGGWHPEIKL